MYLENKLGETKRQNVVLTSDVKNRQNNYNIKHSNIFVLYLRYKNYHFLALDQTYPTKKPNFQKTNFHFCSCYNHWSTFL